jgi:hypothetical protein
MLKKSEGRLRMLGVLGLRAGSAVMLAFMNRERLGVRTARDI